MVTWEILKGVNMKGDDNAPRQFASQNIELSSKGPGYGPGRASLDRFQSWYLLPQLILGFYKLRKNNLKYESLACH